MSWPIFKVTKKVEKRVEMIIQSSLWGNWELFWGFFLYFLKSKFLVPKLLSQLHTDVTFCLFLWRKLWFILSILGCIRKTALALNILFCVCHWLPDLLNWTGRTFIDHSATVKVVDIQVGSQALAFRMISVVPFWIINT